MSLFQAKYDQFREQHTLPTVVTSVPPENDSDLLNKISGIEKTLSDKAYLNPRNLNGVMNGSLRTVDSCGNIFGSQLDNKGRAINVTRWV